MREARGGERGPVPCDPHRGPREGCWVQGRTQITLILPTCFFFLPPPHATPDAQPRVAAQHHHHRRGRHRPQRQAHHLQLREGRKAPPCTSTRSPGRGRILPGLTASPLRSWWCSAWASTLGSPSWATCSAGGRPQPSTVCWWVLGREGGCCGRGKGLGKGLGAWQKGDLGVPCPITRMCQLGSSSHSPPQAQLGRVMAPFALICCEITAFK